MRTAVLILVGGLALLLGPALTLSQDVPSGPGGKGGGKSGKGGGGRTKFGGSGGEKSTSGNPSPGSFGEKKSKGKGSSMRSDMVPPVQPPVQDMAVPWSNLNNSTPGNLTAPRMFNPDERFSKTAPSPPANQGINWSPPPVASPVPVPPRVPEEVSRPVVYRPGNLPRGLPSWFEERDRDRDGQIGMYEWRGSGERVEEFQLLDLNADGFVTAEEVLRRQAWADAGPSPSAGMASANRRPGFGSGGPRMGPGGGGSGGRTR